MNATNARFHYHGKGESLFGLTIVNALLTIITLGVYSFWARNKVREFHYSHTEFDGDRFVYHGTGGELLAGGLKATGILILLAFGVGFGAAFLGPGETTTVVTMVLFYGGFFTLMVLAVNGARRYRLSRSSWRGIRFSYHGQMWEFGENLSVVGTVDWATIMQRATDAGVAAEGLADGLDIDVGLGM